MNTLIYQDFFQFIINEFILIDHDVIQWKLVCKACFNYIHNVYIKKLCNFDDSNVYLKKINIVSLDLTDHIEKIYDKYYIYVDHISLFNFDMFKMYNFKNLYYLKLDNDCCDLYDEHLLYINNLVYLYLGNSKKVTNKGIINNTKLKTLLLGTNSIVDSDIFYYLPNLYSLQISQESPILEKNIPNTVKEVTVLEYVYDIIDELHYCIDIYIVR